jgi:hypothetical protein
MMRRNAAILGTLSLAFCATPLVHGDALGGVVPLDPEGNGTRPTRGKRKLRRHGRKLRSCRRKIGRRVRRRHRRAA